MFGCFAISSAEETRRRERMEDDGKRDHAVRENKRNEKHVKQELAGDFQKRQFR